MTAVLIAAVARPSIVSGGQPVAIADATSVLFTKWGSVHAHSNPLVADGAFYVFLSSRLVLLSLAAIALSWIALVYGAAWSAPSVSIVVAILFMLSNTVVATFIGSRPGIGGAVSRAAYLAVPVTLIGAASVGRRMQRRRISQLVRASPLVAAVVFFTTIVLAEVSTPEGLRAAVANDMTYSLTLIQFALLPLAFVAAVSIVQFAYGIAQVSAEGVRRRRPTVARLALAALLAVEVFLLGWRDRTYWRTELAHHASRIGVVGGWLCLGVLAAYGAGRLHREPSSVEDDPVTPYGTFALVTTQYLWWGLAIAASMLFVGQYTSIHPVGIFLSDHLTFALQDHVRAVSKNVVGGVLAVGALAVLVRRRSTLRQKQIALGFTILAVWNLGNDLPGAFTNVGLHTRDFAALVAVGAILAAVGRPSAEWTGRIVAIALFAWLVAANGHFIELVGRAIGLDGDLVLVFGVALTLLGGSQFARIEGRRIPRSGRTLLWLGYITLSLLIGFWVQLLPSYFQLSELSPNDLAYASVAIPIAAWMAMRGQFRPEARAAELLPSIVKGRVAGVLPHCERARFLPRLSLRASSIVLAAGCVAGALIAALLFHVFTAPHELTVGEKPAALAAADGTVWVASVDDRTITAVGSATGKRVRPAIHLGAEPRAVAVGLGRVWIATAAGDVRVVEARTGDAVVRRISLRSAAPEASPTAIAVSGGRVWVVSDTPQGPVLQTIDPDALQVASTGALGFGGGYASAANGFGRLWITTTADGVLARMDSRAARWAGGWRFDLQPAAVTTGVGAVWLVGSDPQRREVVLRVDPKDLSVTAKTRVGRTDFYVGTGAGIAVSRGSVWVTDSADDTVSRLDAHTGILIGKPIPVGSEPVAVVAAGDSVWVANAGGHTVTRIDASTGKVIE